MREESKFAIEYSSQLEILVKSMILLASVPLKTVIELLSGKKVIAFDDNNSQHKFVLEKLMELASETCKIIENEVSNIETKGKANDLGKQIIIPFHRAIQQNEFFKDDSFQLVTEETNSFEYNVKDNSLNYP